MNITNKIKEKIDGVFEETSNIKKDDVPIEDFLTVEEQTVSIVENSLSLGIDTESLKNAYIYLEQFPKVLQEILKSSFTDISYTNGKIIVRGTDVGIKEIIITEEELISEMASVPLLLATRSGTTFGTENPYLDTDVFCIITNDDATTITKKLRATIFHQKIVDSKEPEFKLRYNDPSSSLTEEQLKDTMANYKVTSDYKMKKDLDETEQELLNKKLKAFNNLINLNRRPTIIIAGATGTGKTEFQKLLVKQIPDKYHSIVSISDTNDAALKKLYPKKDIFELFANDTNFTIDNAIRAGLRSNPDWLLIAEIRDKEIEGFIKACQTNHPGITTIHGSSCSAVVERMTQLYKSSTQDMSIGEDMISSVIGFSPL